MVLNQVFRTLLHSRLKLGIQRYLADDRFQGDIVLLEPREHDAEFFALNPLAFWKRSEAVEHGFESVRMTIEQNYDQLQEVFAHYGLEMSRQAAHAQGRAGPRRARLARHRGRGRPAFAAPGGCLRAGSPRPPHRPREIQPESILPAGWHSLRPGRTAVSPRIL